MLLLVSSVLSLALGVAALALQERDELQEERSERHAKRDQIMRRRAG